MYAGKFYGVVNLPEELALTPWTDLGGVYRLGPVLGVGPLLGTWHELFSSGYSSTVALSELQLEGLHGNDVLSLSQVGGQVQEMPIHKAFQLSFEELNRKLKTSLVKNLKPDGTETTNGIPNLLPPQIVLTAPDGSRKSYDQAFINLWVWAGRPKVAPSLLNKLFP